MESPRWVKWLIGSYTGFLVLFIYAPIICVIMASFSKSRFFKFPYSNFTTKWYDKTFASPAVEGFLSNSLQIGGVVAGFAIVLGFLGALAFVRYDWKGRKIFQKLILLPIFFPQAVLGLALLLWFTYIGIIPNWWTAVLAHLVWIVPIVILVISIQMYGFDASMEEAAYDLGAKRWQVYWEVTLPVLAPGVLSGGLWGFLLSWGNFPLSAFTTGADSTLPEWIFGKMIAAYTPMIPAIGSLIIAAVAVLTFGGLFAFILMRRRQAR